MIAFLCQKKTLIVWALLGVLLFATLSYVDFRLSGLNGTGIIAHQLSFTQQRALYVLNNWGPEGRLFFIRTVWLDYVFPVFLGLFLFGVLHNQLVARYKRLSQKQLLILAIPFLGTFFDYAENSYQVAQALHAETMPEMLFFLTSAISLLKWGCFLGSVILIILNRMAVRKSPAES